MFKCEDLSRNYFGFKGILFGLSLTLLPTAVFGKMTCSMVIPEQNNDTVSYVVGDTWAGTRESPGAAMWGSQLLVAYYDAERWVTVASLNVKTHKLCRIRLPSRFSGWDAHNSLSVAISPDGVLHIAGNAHASPLFYARGNPNDLDSIHVEPMVGKDEDKATYPTFLRASDNSMAFFYRNGISGNGIGLMNRWENGAWHRLGEVFVQTDGQLSTSAYPSEFVVSSKKTTHIAIVWRHTPDVSSNYAVTYAYTHDFQTWFDHNNRPLKMPLSPRQSDIIEEPGQHAGLVNAAHLVLTPDLQPIVLYPRYGKDGHDAIIAARPNGSHWELHEIATSSHRSDVAGGGAMTGLPNFSVQAAGWQAKIHASFPNLRGLILQLDLRTLETKLVEDEHGQGGGVGVHPIPAGLADAANISVPVRASGFDGSTFGRLEWFAEAPDHDRPRECTQRAPLACTPPPSPLRWIISLKALQQF